MRFCKCCIIILLVANGSTVGQKEVNAQSGGALFVVADSTAASREITDTPGICRVYIVHEGFVAGSQFSAARFKVQNNGFSGSWLFDDSEFVTIGNSQSGISISYNGCLTPPVLVVVISYMCFGTSGCTTVSLVPDPTAVTGEIEAYDCVGGLLIQPNVYELCVNGALVPDDHFGSCDCPLPAENSTWGKIKGIYE
jgi:hypothetical protein